MHVKSESNIYSIIWAVGMKTLAFVLYVYGERIVK